MQPKDTQTRQLGSLQTHGYIFTDGAACFLPVPLKRRRGERPPLFRHQNAHTAKDKKKYTNLNIGTTFDFNDNWNLLADYAFSTRLDQSTSSRPTFSGREPWYTPVAWNDANGNRIYVDENGNITNDEGMPGYRLPYVNYITSDKTYFYKYSFVSEKHTFNAVTNYNLKLAEDHNFKFMAGTNIESYKWDSHWSNKTELIDEKNPQFNFAVGTETVGGGANWDSQVGGVFSRINYSFMDKYLLETNLRYDATSKFPSNLRWRWYPSFSGGWVITNESFMAPLDPILSFAKIRASWGKIGDQSVSNALYLATMDINKIPGSLTTVNSIFSLALPILFLQVSPGRI